MTLQTDPSIIFILYKFIYKDLLNINGDYRN